MSEGFKKSADTPLVIRSPYVERGQAIIMNGDEFEDGQPRVIVSRGVSDEAAAQITDFLTDAEVERARIAEKIAIIERVMTRADRSE